MDNNAAFARLRSLLDGTPQGAGLTTRHPATGEQVHFSGHCAEALLLLKQWPDDEEKQVAIDFVHSHLPEYKQFLECLVHESSFEEGWYSTDELFDALHSEALAGAFDELDERDAMAAALQQVVHRQGFLIPYLDGEHPFLGLADVGMLRSKAYEDIVHFCRTGDRRRFSKQKGGCVGTLAEAPHLISFHPQKPPLLPRRGSTFCSWLDAPTGQLCFIGEFGIGIDEQEEQELASLAASGGDDFVKIHPIPPGRYQVHICQLEDEYICRSLIDLWPVSKQKKAPPVEGNPCFF